MRTKNILLRPWDGVEGVGQDAVGETESQSHLGAECAHEARAGARRRGTSLDEGCSPALTQRLSGLPTLSHIAFVLALSTWR